MRWFFDTEFYENGSTIDLISIGLVSEDGRSYYREVDFAKARASSSDWLKQNVLPRLTGNECSRMKIANEIRELVTANGERPEFWAYFADYDWVVLCQLYGPMIALPKGFPFYCRDLKQLMDEHGVTRDMLPVKFGAAHNAAHDALWARDVYRWMMERIDLLEGERMQRTLQRSLRLTNDGSALVFRHGDVLYPVKRLDQLPRGPISEGAKEQS